MHVPRIEQELRTSAASSRTSMLYLVDILYGLLLEKDYEQDMERLIETSQMLEKKKREEDLSLEELPN